MTYHIVFLDRATIPHHIQLRQVDADCCWKDFDLTESDHILARALDADILVVNKVILDESLLSQLPKLKHIAVFATGYNNIDIDYCKANGISVSNTKDYSITSVPEHTIALMFALKRHLFAYQYSMQRAEWQQSPFFHHYLAQTQDVAGSQLGIVGGGSLGQATGKLARALGMTVVFSDRKGAPASGKEGYIPFEQLIKESDVVSLHCPLTDDTKNLIGLTEMQQMKPTTILLNCSRGGLVNEADLVVAFERKLIAGAGFDVASTEPIADDNPLLELLDKPNFILTPHVAWMSDGAMQTQAGQVVSNIESYVNGNSVDFVV